MIEVIGLTSRATGYPFPQLLSVMHLHWYWALYNGFVIIKLGGFYCKRLGLPVSLACVTHQGQILMKVLSVNYQMYYNMLIVLNFTKCFSRIKNILMLFAISACFGLRGNVYIIAFL